MLYEPPWLLLPYIGIGNVVNGQYRYIQDPHKLEATATGMGPSIFKPATSLHLPAWYEARADHPDKQFSSYILNGIAHGFHIGAVRAGSLRSNQSNMPSVQLQSQLVASQISDEKESGRLLGPLPPHLASLVRMSPIGLIPKPHQPGKWKLIVDLSSPGGASVNDSIDTHVCHMRYASLLDAAELIMHLGAGSQLAKVDLQQAYRIVPVHPDDHHLLGIRWGQDVYIDTALPFGLRSAAKKISAVADALASILHSKGVAY